MSRRCSQFERHKNCQECLVLLLEAIAMACRTDRTLFSRKPNPRNILLTRLLLKLCVAITKAKKIQRHVNKELKKPDTFASNRSLGVVLTTFLSLAIGFANVLNQVPHNLQGRSVYRESGTAEILPWDS